MLKGFQFGGALIGGNYFGLTRTEGWLALTDWFPCNWDARSAYEKTRERAKFEQFEKSDLFDCTTKLTTIVGVTEGCELVEFWQGRHRWFYVGLFIMIMWEMVEWLYCWRGLWVEVYAVLIYAREIFESMNCGLVMLSMWSISVWGNTCECRCNIRPIEGRKTIDTAQINLIDLFSTRKIRI